MTVEFFKRIELPSHMLISELVSWIALGRVPEVGLDKFKLGFDNYEYVDWRRNPEHVYNDWASETWGPFSQAEFSILDMEIDFDEYVNMWATVGEQTSEDILLRFNELTEHLSKAGVQKSSEWYDDEKNTASEDAKVAENLRALEAPFQQLIDRAFSKVFNVLSSGALKSEAWIFANRDDEESEPWLDPVPTNIWTFRDFDLNTCDLVSGKIRYASIQVLVTEAMTLFPTPEPVLKAGSGSVIGDTLMLSTGRASALVRRPVGRPPKGTATARDVTQRIFRQKLLRGELPEKKEAQIQEVVDFVQEAFGEKVARSTAQSYLKGIY